MVIMIAFIFWIFCVLKCIVCYMPNVYLPSVTMVGRNGVVTMKTYLRIFQLQGA